MGSARFVVGLLKKAAITIFDITEKMKLGTLNSTIRIFYLKSWDRYCCKIQSIYTIFLPGDLRS